MENANIYSMSNSEKAFHESGFGQSLQGEQEIKMFKIVATTEEYTKFSEYMMNIPEVSAPLAAEQKPDNTK